MPREDTIVESILTYINSLPYGVAEKVHGSAMSSGKADINACYKGVSLRLEVKTPDHGNKPSKKQKMNLRRWAAAGARCATVYGLEEVIQILDEIDKEVNHEFICN